MFCILFGFYMCSFSFSFFFFFFCQKTFWIIERAMDPNKRLAALITIIKNS